MNEFWRQLANAATQSWVWSAIGTTLALATFLITNLPKRPLWYRRMQRLLRTERAFYDSVASRAVAPDHQSEEALAIKYFDAVDQGLAGIAELTSAERRTTAAKLGELIDELQISHATLVKALQPFAEQGARAFLDNWHATANDLGTVYFGGTVASSAHTHCSAVEQLVNQLVHQAGLKNAKLAQLGYSVVVYDADVVVPVMNSILSKCDVEAGLISQSIAAGDVRRAIMLKEKMWFDMRGMYTRVNRALGGMRAAAQALSSAAA
jgi:hypothetical protein